MNMTGQPKGACSECGARWSWLGRSDEWFVANKHGRPSLRAGKVVNEQPVPLTRCPECGAKVIVEVSS